MKGYRAIIVCTDKRGVFFGYVPKDKTAEQIMTVDPTTTLERARMAVRWTKVERGVIGLASHGPSVDCRIGPPATITVKDVHAVFEVENPEAIERWESEPWG